MKNRARSKLVATIVLLGVIVSVSVRTTPADARPTCDACTAGACRQSVLGPTVEEENVDGVIGQIISKHKSKPSTACENCLKNCVNSDGSGGGGGDFGSDLDLVCIDKFCEECADHTFCHSTTEAADTTAARQAAIRAHSHYQAAWQKVHAPQPAPSPTCGGCNRPPCPQ